MRSDSRSADPRRYAHDEGWRGFRGKPQDPEKGCGGVRVLAYLALTENRQFSLQKAEYVRCATWSIPRGVSSIRVFCEAFGDASVKTWI